MVTSEVEYLKPKKVPKGSLTFKDLEKQFEQNQQERQAKLDDIANKFASPYIFVDVDTEGNKFTDVLAEIIESERVPGILRKVTNPKWYQQTPWGTPRLVDTRQIRQLASHVVFQSCVNVWQSDIQSSDYEIIIDDRNKRRSRKLLQKSKSQPKRINQRRFRTNDQRYHGNRFWRRNQTSTN